MKKSLIVSAACAAAIGLQAEIIPIDISPAGTSAAEGLSPLNEVPPVENSTGSGDEVLTGITYDTESMQLSVVFAYGSFAGFTDLTGPMVGVHIHGPAGIDENAGVAFDFTDFEQHLYAPDPAKGGIVSGGALLDEEQESVLMKGLFYINVHTKDNPGGEIRGQLIPMLNNAPSLTCPDPITAECDPANPEIEVTATVSDPDGGKLNVTLWVNGEEVESQAVTAPDDGSEVDVTFAYAFEVGEHVVAFSVEDETEKPVTCETTVTITDTTAPEIERIAAMPDSLWPPNHKMVPVEIRLDAIDCSEVTNEIVEVTSNEPLNDIGDGNTDIDWVITGPMTVDLRAERAGNRTGRIYTVTVKSTDAEGNSTMSEVEVHVAHDQSGRDRVGSGQAARPRR